MSRVNRKGEPLPPNRIRVRVKEPYHNYFPGDVIGVGPHAAKVLVKSGRCEWYSRADKKACLKADAGSDEPVGAPETVETPALEVQVREPDLGSMSAAQAVQTVKKMAIDHAEYLMDHLDKESRKTVRNAIEYRLSTLAAEQEAAEVSGGFE